MCRKNGARRYWAPCGILLVRSTKASAEPLKLGMKVTMTDPALSAAAGRGWVRGQRLHVGETRGLGPADRRVRAARPDFPDRRHLDVRDPAGFVQTQHQHHLSLRPCKSWSEP